MILLDTHAWLWLAAEPKRLSAVATAAVKAATAVGGLAIASISLWELAWMMAHGRLEPRGLPEAALADLVDRTGVIIKEITPTIATLAMQFPRDFPADPADRLIGATARAEGLALVTRDARLRASRLLRTVW